MWLGRKRIKERKEVRIRQVEMTGRNVGELVGWTGQIVNQTVISMVTLMQGGEA
jgi:hypothetical protein